MPRTAIIGASGIGKHHAKWWAMEGAEVCAFAGSSSKSAARTQTVLKDLFGFQGRGWNDAGAMLAAEHPDFVDVCSPNHLHYDHVRACIDAGCHVLCEKPFVYAPSHTPSQILEQARDLITRASSRGLWIGMCAQYALAGQFALEAYRRVDPATPVRSLRAELASPARGRPPAPLPIWIDLGPHLLAAIQMMEPEATIEWTTLRRDFRGDHAEVRFQLQRPDGSGVECTLIAGRTRGDPGHIRRISVNDYPCDFLGTNDTNGVYRTRIVTPDHVRIEPDMMHLLIREFMAGNIITGPAFILRNLEWLLSAAPPFPDQ